MRVEARAFSLSWIPLKAVSGLASQVPFHLGVMHYDLPPPDSIADIGAFIAADRCRFANELRAWIDVVDGRIVNYGQQGTGHINVTTLRVARRVLSFKAVPYPTLTPPPVIGDGWVRFTQTAGGRTALPAPRVSRHRGMGDGERLRAGGLGPPVQLIPPPAWTTIAVTIHAGGSVHRDLVGASPFPRHWLYDDTGRLVRKSGVIDFGDWYGRGHAERTPWQGADHHVPMVDVESALERTLSVGVIDRRPPMRRLRPGELLTEQGRPDDTLYLLFDGMLRVEVDDDPVAVVGPGAILGEQAMLNDGTRSATLRALTACRVAVVDPGDVDIEALWRIARGRTTEATPA